MENSVIINEVSVLSKDCYEEKAVKEISADTPSQVGMHTLHRV